MKALKLIGSNYAFEQQKVGLLASIFPVYSSIQRNPGVSNKPSNQGYPIIAQIFNHFETSNREVLFPLEGNLKLPC